MGSEQKVRRKEKQEVETFSMLARPLDSVYVLVSLGGLRVWPLNCLFQQ